MTAVELCLPIRGPRHPLLHATQQLSQRQSTQAENQEPTVQYASSRPVALKCRASLKPADGWTVGSSCGQTRSDRKTQQRLPLWPGVRRHSRVQTAGSVVFTWRGATTPTLFPGRKPTEHGDHGCTEQR